MAAGRAASSELAVCHREISKKRQKIAHVFSGVAAAGLLFQLDHHAHQRQPNLNEQPLSELNENWMIARNKNVWNLFFVPAVR